MSAATLREAKPKAVPAAAERVRRFDTLLLVVVLAYPMFRGLLAGSQFPLLVSTASCALFAFRNVNLRMSLRAAHAVWLLLGVFAHMTQSAVKSHNGPADRLQSVGGACR